MHQQRKQEEERENNEEWKGDKSRKFWELFTVLGYPVDIMCGFNVSNSLLRNAKGNNLHSLFRSWREKQNNGHQNSLH